MTASIYITSFGAPGQFKAMIESLDRYDSDFISKCNKYLINNSGDNYFSEYQQICDRWNFTHLNYNNLGIMGARFEAAKHFNSDISDYYFYFEDDMLLEKSGQCRFGFSRWCEKIFLKTIEIIKNEDLDFLKLNFTEVRMANDCDWIRTLELSNSIGFGNKIWFKTKFNQISTWKSLPYATGEIYLSNWPVVMSKRGNRLCYLESKIKNGLEHHLSKEVHKKIISGKIKSAVLLLSPVVHQRLENYSERRVES